MQCVSRYELPRIILLFACVRLCCRLVLLMLLVIWTTTVDQSRMCFFLKGIRIKMLLRMIKQEEFLLSSVSGSNIFLKGCEQRFLRARSVCHQVLKVGEAKSVLFSYLRHVMTRGSVISERRRSWKRGLLNILILKLFTSGSHHITSSSMLHSLSVSEADTVHFELGLCCCQQKQAKKSKRNPTIKLA